MNNQRDKNSAGFTSMFRLLDYTRPMARARTAERNQPARAASPEIELARPRIVVEERNITVEVFRALADPVRLELLALIAARGPICVCHLDEALPYSQSRISKHLAVLRRAELVETRREGTWVYYSLAKGGLDVAGEFLAQVESSRLTPHLADTCSDPG
jgi:ArsR family transcriptional regulator